MEAKQISKLATALLVIATVTSCAKEIAIEDDSKEQDNSSSTLIVQTRSGDTDDGEISYPVNIFVFNTDNTCVGTDVIADESSTFSMQLEAGDYNVYAIAGADETRYDIPTQEDATPTSTVSLKSGQEHTDLMTTTGSPVTLSENGTNTLEISLNRKVLMVKDITIKDLPETATAVNVRLSPLYKDITLNGNYEGETYATIPLTKDDDNNWTYSTGVYLLPATGDASITVSVAYDNDTKSYSYTSSSQLEANHKISIVGSYKAGTIDMSGTIKGATWDEERTIEFVFKENSAETTNNTALLKRQRWEHFTTKRVSSYHLRQTPTAL